MSLASIGSVKTNIDRFSLESTSDFDQHRRETIESKLYYLRDTRTPEEFDHLVDAEMRKFDAQESGIPVKALANRMKSKIFNTFKTIINTNNSSATRSRQTRCNIPSIASHLMIFRAIVTIESVQAWGIIVLKLVSTLDYNTEQTWDLPSRERSGGETPFPSYQAASTSSEDLTRSSRSSPPIYHISGRNRPLSGLT